MSKGFKVKFRAKKLYHPEGATASAIQRGRHLEPEAVNTAKNYRMGLLRQLSQRPILSLTFKERHQLHNLQVEFKTKKGKANDRRAIASA